jgi:fructose-bisphosphate aldolase, class I
VIHQQALIATAQAMVAPGKGLLAMDESPATCNQRFAAAGMAPALLTLERRLAWRELLLGAPGLSSTISGVILADEALWQNLADGRPFAELAREAGVLVGIKVDTGAHALAGHPDEKVAEGLDGLRERLHAYSDMGARFAKWRAVITADHARPPSAACLAANAHALARYAALCQEAGLVPVVEPELLMDDAHTLQRCQEMTEAVLRCVFEQLAQQGVLLEALILKPNMVICGPACPEPSTLEEVAGATLQCLRRSVPAAVPGILFLSGGQPGALASSRLNAMHQNYQPGLPPAQPALPWPLSFSFARALQHPALEIWAGQDAQRAAAQQALLHRARCNSAALKGAYSAEMEGP